MKNEILLSQNEIADLFNIHHSNVSRKLIDKNFILTYALRMGRGGYKNLPIKKYGLESIHFVAVSCRKIEKYFDFCKENDIKPENYVVTKKQYDFSSLLERFLNDRFLILKEHVIGKYRVDFYVPDIKLIIEYDEKDHNLIRNYKADKNRELYLINNFNLNIIRIKENKEIEGLGDISEYLQNM